MTITKSLQSFGAIVRARTMEFVRDRGAFFWNLFFPILMIVAFTFLFSGGGAATFSIGTIGTVPGGFDLLETRGVEHINYSERELTEEEALEPLRKHQIDMLINFESGTYYINNQAPKAELSRTLMMTSSENTGEDLRSTFGLRESGVSGEPIRYVDWIMPGILGMNMMFSCLFGVGFILVRYRKNGVLKRMKATPISALTFLSAQAISRFIIVIIASAVVYFGTNLFFNFSMNGSWLNLLLVLSLGILCMISLGLIFSARIKNEELAGGLLQLVTWPMMMLSGIFFSIENAPPFVQRLALIFPLTHYVNGARAVMIEGATLLQILPNILYLSIFAGVFLVISSLLFKWE